jgi:hypothetical protein
MAVVKNKIFKEIDMQIKNKYWQGHLALIMFSSLCFANNAIAAFAESDMKIQEKVLRARENTQLHSTDHAAHSNVIDKSKEFHGVFYGFLPCQDCNGIKTTLSLKQNNNYLLVTQPARESSREFYEKGKYTWDDETHTVSLLPRNDAPARKYYIENEGSLIQLNSDGSRVPSNQANDYTLRRSDMVKSREVHIH